MKIMLVGGGAREHAMAAAIKRTPGPQLFVVMKVRNPGLLALADNVLIHDETDITTVVAHAQAMAVDLVVVGPESPLEAGLTDALEATGIATASPSKAAARIETDKKFMRELMLKHDVPGQLGYHAFSNQDDALKFLDENGPVWAIKPTGLTGGKGVQVYGDHFEDLAGAKQYAASIFASGAGGGTLQFEELAIGEEFTVMAFTDGTTVLPMVAVQDHKRLLEGDEGPNTGGMGSYTQANGLLPFLDADDVAEASTIVQALVDALRAEGCPYKGTIYGQFMLTVNGPKVIEVNARFGDPEAMNVCHLLDADYPAILGAIASGELVNHTAAFRPRATVVKYMVPTGYGMGNPLSNQAVVVDESALATAGATVYYANIEQAEDGTLSTLTSRTLGVLGEGETIAEAEAACEAGLQCIKSDALFVRHDIGTAQLLEKKVRHMADVRAMQAAQ